MLIMKSARRREKNTRIWLPLEKSGIRHGWNALLKMHMGIRTTLQHRLRAGWRQKWDMTGKPEMPGKVVMMDGETAQVH